MARLTDAAGHTLLWNLDKCEDTAVTGAYVIVSARVKQDWMQDFAVKFFSQGLAVSDAHLTKLNTALRRCGIDELDIRETDASDYARDFSDYATKIAFREEQRHRFATASADQRIDIMHKAADDMTRLLPPHMTLAEYRQAYPRHNWRAEVAALAAERRRRRAALEAATVEAQVQQAKPTLGIEQAIVLLRHTETPALIDRIIERLDTDAQLQLVASEHVPQQLKDLIIDRILAA
jgi:hypothetical protein